LRRTTIEIRLSQIPLAVSDTLNIMSSATWQAVSAQTRHSPFLKEREVLEYLKFISSPCAITWSQGITNQIFSLIPFASSQCSTMQSRPIPCIADVHRSLKSCFLNFSQTAQRCSLIPLNCSPTIHPSSSGPQTFMFGLNLLRSLSFPVKILALLIALTHALLFQSHVPFKFS
jgi:hypothetical protein